MTSRSRTRVWAAVVGFVVAVAVVGSGFLIAAAIDDSAEHDGSFVLDEPGVFQQPLGDVNEDSSGEQLPNSVLTDAEGAEHRLTELRGTPLVVNLWFSNCVPCRRELVDFATVHREVGDRIQFVGVNPFDTVAGMEEFAADRGVAYPLWRDTERALTNDLGVIGYPVTLFVSADGEILRQTGEIDADSLRAAIEELF
jgi:peroxiredoxin